MDINSYSYINNSFNADYLEEYENENVDVLQLKKCHNTLFDYIYFTVWYIGFDAEYYGSFDTQDQAQEFYNYLLHNATTCAPDEYTVEMILEDLQGE